MVKTIKGSTSKYEFPEYFLTNPINTNMHNKQIHHANDRQKYFIKNINMHSKSKGIIFVWPQRKKYHSNKESAVFLWFFAQCFYCLHMLNLWPNGTAMLLDKPAWKYEAPLLKPETHDYIIEPDWDSK